MGLRDGLLLVVLGCFAACEVFTGSGGPLDDRLVPPTSSSREFYFKVFIRKRHECGSPNSVPGSGKDQVPNDHKLIRSPRNVPTNDRAVSGETKVTSFDKTPDSQQPHLSGRIISNDRAVSEEPKDASFDKGLDSKQPHLDGRIISNDRAVSEEPKEASFDKGPDSKQPHLDGRIIPNDRAVSEEPKEASFDKGPDSKQPHLDGRIISNDRAVSEEPKKASFDKEPSDDKTSATTNSTSSRAVTTDAPAAPTEDTPPPWEEESPLRTDLIVCAIVVLGLLFLGIFWCFNRYDYDAAALASRRADTARANGCSGEHMPLDTYAADDG